MGGTALNTELKSKTVKSGKAFRIKLVINMVIILIVGMNWGNTKVITKNGELYDKSEVSYTIELFSGIKKDSQAVFNTIEAKEYAFEALLSAQEEPQVTVENSVNTFEAGAEFAINAEEAYSFGRNEGKKYAFLTFDDGPSPNVTNKVLDILKQYDVKATFFVLGKSVEGNPHMIKRELEEGHALANHTYSHDYKKLYPKKNIDVNLFAEELEKNQRAVKAAAGKDINMRVVRFPGGSFEHWKDPMKEEIKKRGMHYIDWNAENGDGFKPHVSVNEQLERIKMHISWSENTNKNVVILMHDAPAKDTTADALPKLIEYIKARGYEFRTLK